MPAKFSKTQLNTMFLEDLKPRLDYASAPTEKCLLINLKNPKRWLKAYIFNCTCPPGGRALDEYKIQLILEGQKRGERGRFDDSDGRRILIVGYATPFGDDDDGVYGLNNINKLLQLNNPAPAVTIGVWQFKKDDPILFNDSERFSCLYNNLKGRVVNIDDNAESVYFVVEIDIELTEDEVELEDGLEFISANNKKTQVGFMVNRRKPYSSDSEETTNYHIVPFQIAYAVSIHKSQGLEFDSVKIVIADETEERISHNIFYTAITRARAALTIYWSPEVCDRILTRIRPENSNKDFFLLKSKRSDK